jgi:hypothetical protein
MASHLRSLCHLFGASSLLPFRQKYAPPPKAAGRVVRRQRKPMAVWFCRSPPQRCGYSQLAALLAVLGRENLEIAAPLKARLQHVEVVVIVLDVEHFRC